MRNHWIISVMLATITGTFGFSCTCGDYQGDFVDVAQKSDLVVYGEVISHEENSLLFTVLEIFHGDENRLQLRVWGDNGALCRPYVSKFPPGTQWIFALHRVSPIQGKGSGSANTSKREKKTNFAISICGEYYLKVKGDKVFRAYFKHLDPARAEDSLPLENVKKQLSQD